MLKEVSGSELHDDIDGRFYYAREVIDWEKPEIAPPYSDFTGFPSVTWYRRLYATAVYVIGPHNGDHCKIGMSVSPVVRLSELQIGSWDRLKVHFALFIYDDRAYEVEQAALSLAGFRGAEIRGEWVGMKPIDAFRMVLDAAEIAKVHACNFETAARNEEDIATSRVHSRQTLMRKAEMAEKKVKWARLGY